MTGFWDGIDGTKEKANSDGFVLIPDGTVAKAEIQRFIFIQGEGDYPACFNIQWKIIDGDYTNRVVFQNIKVFDVNEGKAQRARNMMMYLFKIFNVPVTQSQPSNDDLLAFNGKMASITIFIWMMGERSGNWVSRVDEIVTQSNPFSDDIPF